MKTYKQITDFWSEAAQYLLKGKDDKLSSAIRKMLGDPLKRRPGILSEILDAHKEQKDKIYLKHCSVDAAKNILRDSNKDLVFTVDALILREKEVKALAVKTYEIDPVYVSTEDLPEDLDEYQKEVFKGFIIE